MYCVVHGKHCTLHCRVEYSVKCAVMCTVYSVEYIVQSKHKEQNIKNEDFRSELYSTVKCSTVHYSTLHYSTVHCSAVHCSSVQSSAVQCSAVLCRSVQCSSSVPRSTAGAHIVSLRTEIFHTVQYSAVLCSAVQGYSTQCSKVQCSTVQGYSTQCSTVQYSAVQYSTGIFHTVMYCTIRWQGYSTQDLRLNFFLQRQFHNIPGIGFIMVASLSSSKLPYFFLNSTMYIAVLSSIVAASSSCISFSLSEMDKLLESSKSSSFNLPALSSKLGLVHNEIQTWSS